MGLYEITAKSKHEAYGFHFRSASVRERVKPEQLLWAAIAIQAVADCDAAFIASRRFLDCCLMAGIDSEFIRGMTREQAKIAYRWLLKPQAQWTSTHRFMAVDDD